MTQGNDPVERGALDTRRLTARDLRDALWLAMRIAATTRPPVLDTPEPARPVVTHDSTPDDPPPEAPRSDEPVPRRVADGRRSANDRTSDPTDGFVTEPLSGATPLLPVVPVLPDRSRIARALRPLNRAAPSPWRRVLDEEATAVLAAQDGLWVPEWRPEAVHPFDVALVVDTSPSMAIWQHTAHEFTELLRRQGAFLDVRRYRLDFSPTTPQGLRLHPEGTGSGTVPWTRLREPAGRRLVLVVTDGIGDAWRSGAAGHLLHHWGRTMPVAVVHVLDQRLWPWSALDTRRVRLSSPSPGSPNRVLRVWTDGREAVTADPRGTVVPVLALSPEWLAGWARLVSTHGAGWVDTTATIARPYRDEPVLEPPSPLDIGARERVLRFRTIASVTAFRLAVLLAAAPLDLSSMKLVHSVMLPGSGLSALAEVLLGGLLVKLPAPDEPTVARVDYDFHPGVREELLTGLHRADTVRVARLLGNHAAPSVIALRNYAKAVDTPDDVELLEPSPANAPHLRVQEAVFRALSGPYLARANRLAALRFGARGPNAHEPTRARRPAPDHRPEVWGRMPLRNPDFIGREELLDVVRQRLAEPGVVVLHGTGGVGKSQTAVEYLYRHAAEYQVVWWIPAEHPAQVRTSFVELAKRLGIPASSAATAVPGVLEALRVGEPHSRWILVFDNADRVEDVLPFLPTGGGHIVVTSRNPAWTEVARPLRVDPFTRPESIELLRRHSDTRTDEEADALAEALGDLPLAVEHAAAWLARSGMQVTEYLDLLDKSRVELVEAGTSTEDELPVAAAWNVPLSRLAEIHPAALQLLQLCAFFGPEPIPQRLFRGAREASVPVELAAALEDPIALGRAIRQITAYSLAKIDHRHQTLQLHRLVQSVLMSRLGEEQREQFRHAAHVLLINGDPDEPDRAANWRRYAELLPHAARSRAVDCRYAWTRKLMANLVRYLLERGDYAGAVELADECASTWRPVLGEAELPVLEMARLQALGLRWLGRFKEARELNDQTYEALREKVGDVHETVLGMLDTRAVDRRWEGRFVEGLRLHESVYEKAREVLGPDDPDTLKYANNLGGGLRNMGHFTRARELDDDTVRRRTDILGQDHLSTYRSLNALAVDIRECGDYGEALELLEENLVRQRELFGDDHPFTIGAMRSLAVTRCRAGDHTGARTLAEECLTRYRRRHGDQNIDTVTSLMTLSVDLRHLEELAQARETAEHSHRLFVRINGAHHPFTLVAATNLAIAHRLSGDLGRAHALDLEATATLRRVLGHDHPFSLVTATNLASDLAALGDHLAATALDEDTWKRSSRVLGPQHPSTLAVALNLALDLAALGDTIGSAEWHAGAVSGLRRTLGEHHSATLSAVASTRANCDMDTMEL